jgi:hypothetical protein
MGSSRSLRAKLTEENPMRSLIVLTLAALSVAACSYRTETVERQAPAGRTVVTESASIGTPTLVVPD